MRKHRSMVYPVHAPDGYSLAEKIAARAAAVYAETAAGANPLDLLFPVPRGRYWRASNFDRRVLGPAYRLSGWRDSKGDGPWTWRTACGTCSAQPPCTTGR